MTLGPIQANCFVLGCKKTKEAVVIDPGDEAEKILMSLAKDQLTLKHIINTHGHFDHVGANKKLKEVTNADIMIHTLDKDMLAKSKAAASAFGIQADAIPNPDRLLEDSDVVVFGKHQLKILHTPGHTQGSVSIYTEYVSDSDGETKKYVFAGDTLFAGSIGRTDFPGGDLNILLSSIRNTLFQLGDDVIVYPGHMQATTIGVEKRSNPFCGTND